VILESENGVPRRVKGILQTGQEEADFIDLKIQELKKIQNHMFEEMKNEMNDIENITECMNKPKLYNE